LEPLSELVLEPTEPMEPMSELELPAPELLAPEMRSIADGPLRVPLNGRQDSPPLTRTSRARTTELSPRRLRMLFTRPAIPRTTTPRTTTGPELEPPLELALSVPELRSTTDGPLRALQSGRQAFPPPTRTFRDKTTGLMARRLRMLSTRAVTPT